MAIQVLGPLGVGYFSLSSASPPVNVQLVTVALSKAINVTVTNLAAASTDPLTTFETVVRQASIAKVQQAALPSGGDISELFDGLQNDTAATITVSSVDSAGIRTVVAGPVEATPQAVPLSATELASATPPILLLHGFLSDATTWAHTFNVLTNASFSVTARSLDAGSDNPCQQAFGDTTPNVPSLAGWISDVKQATGATRVLLIGHSQGGIVGRLYLQAGANPTAFADALAPFAGSALEDQILACFTWLENRGAAFASGQVDVAGLITYGTPHNGATSVGSIHPILREGSPFFAVMNDFTKFPVPPGVLLTSIVGKTSPISNDDCLVEVGSQDMSKLFGAPAGIAVPDPVAWRKHASYSTVGAFCPAAAFGRTAETRDASTIMDSLKAQVLKISTLSPISVSITSPSGKVIEKARTQLWGATYEEFLDESGDKKGVVTIPFPERGAYQIRVIPDEGAAPTATFSITSKLDGILTTLVDHAPVSTAVSSPFIVSKSVFNHYCPVKRPAPRQRASIGAA